MSCCRLRLMHVRRTVTTTNLLDFLKNQATAIINHECDPGMVECNTALQRTLHFLLHSTQ